ncbi:hypothetical protein HTZ77_13950 [Nonomuraea sp. SMC257]|uniref:Uncharacterized protein n=1 Tax=Nonomuraea montanisoli TaxID=2741721 RepID=A0A7Y6I6V4_9ACTN|nr:hypothetical protein [Nonomuraea montanisoli]NUW32526.1 hypothetical protein [Nonomuraea montanisoli]
MRPWDAFAAVEADVRAMVADPRWQDLPVPVRAQAIASRTLVTPDGDRWLFGAHARWHLHDPADGRWHPAPPPRGARVRPAEHAAAVLPARVIPRGPDFAAEPGSTQAFVGPDVPDHLTEQIRVLVRAAGRRSELDFPLTAFGEIFAGDVPSTVAAVWGVVMWCAYAPAFDGNERLLTIFGEYLRRPLPGDEWVRWLPAPPLLDLVRLVAERQRAGRPRESLRLTAIMADAAHILLSDTRFRPRALALLTMVEPALSQPGLDERAARRDDESVRQAWLERCPARLARALLPETDPETHFAHTVYDLMDALSFTRDPARAAATLLADLSDSRGLLPGRLDHRLRHAYEELARAGLTGTSAAETTHPGGFEVLGPSQPLPGPPGALGARTGAWAPPRPPDATGAWAPPRPPDATGAWSQGGPTGSPGAPIGSPDGPTGSPDGPTGAWSPADSTGAWTPPDTTGSRRAGDSQSGEGGRGAGDGRGTVSPAEPGEATGVWTPPDATGVRAAGGGRGEAPAVPGEAPARPGAAPAGLDEATGAWTSADDADSTGAWTPGGPAATPGLPGGPAATPGLPGGPASDSGLPGTGARERHTEPPRHRPGSPEPYTGFPGPQTGTSQRHSGSPERHPGSPERHTGSPERHTGSSGPRTGPGPGFPAPYMGSTERHPEPHTGSSEPHVGSSWRHMGGPEPAGGPGQGGGLVHTGPDALDRSGHPAHPGADDRGARHTGDRDAQEAGERGIEKAHESDARESRERALRQDREHAFRQDHDRAPREDHEHALREDRERVSREDRERGGSGLFRRSGEHGRSGVPQTENTGRTGNGDAGGLAVPGSTGQGSTGQGSTGQGSTGQGSAAPGSAGPKQGAGAPNTDSRNTDAPNTGARNSETGGIGRARSAAGRLPQIVRGAPDGEGTRSGRLAAAVARRVLSRRPRQPVTSGFEIEPPDRATAAAVLGAAYAAGLAWQAVSGARVPERGFAGQAALVRRIVHERDDLPS